MRMIDRELKISSKDMPEDELFLKRLHGELARDIPNWKNNRRNSGSYLLKAMSIALFVIAAIGGSLLFMQLNNYTNKISITPVPDHPGIAEENVPQQAESLIPIYQNKKYGFINFSGDVIIKPQFDYVSSFNEYGVATVMKKIDGQTQYGLLGPYGLLTDINFWDIGGFHEGIARVRDTNGKYGFLDTKGKWIVEPVYDSAVNFSEGMAAVGILIKGTTEQNSEKGSDSVSDIHLWGFIDNSGKVIVEPQYGKAGSFSNGLAFVQEQGSWKTAAAYYIDKQGNKLIKLPWEWILGASDFSDDGTAIISIADEYNRAVSYSGVINKKGELILPFDYGHISKAVNGLRVASPGKNEVSGGVGIIDSKGKWVVQPKYFEMGPITNGLVYARVARNGRQYAGILKMDGTWLYEPTRPDVFNFQDDMVVFIEDTGRNGVNVEMSLYDLQGNQLLAGRTYNHIEILSKEFIRCGTVTDNRKGTVQWDVLSPQGMSMLPGSNIRTARRLPDEKVIANVLKEDGFYVGIIAPDTKQWILEPVYYAIIRYQDGSGIGIRRIDSKSTEENVVFVTEIFNQLGQVIYTSSEETMTLDEFQMNWLEDNMLYKLPDGIPKNVN